MLNEPGPCPLMGMRHGCTIVLGADITERARIAQPMGTPEAGKLFLQALTGSGLGSQDLIEDSMFDTVALQTITDIRRTKGD